MRKPKRNRSLWRFPSIWRQTDIFQRRSAQSTRTALFVLACIQAGQTKECLHCGEVNLVWKFGQGIKCIGQKQTECLMDKLTRVASISGPAVLECFQTRESRPADSALLRCSKVPRVQEGPSASSGICLVVSDAWSKCRAANGMSKSKLKTRIQLGKPAPRENGMMS